MAAIALSNSWLGAGARTSPRFPRCPRSWPPVPSMPCFLGKAFDNMKSRALAGEKEELTLNVEPFLGVLHHGKCVLLLVPATSTTLKLIERPQGFTVYCTENYMCLPAGKMWLKQ